MEDCAKTDGPQPLSAKAGGGPDFYDQFDQIALSQEVPGRDLQFCERKKTQKPLTIVQLYFPKELTRLL